MDSQEPSAYNARKLNLAIWVHDNIHAAHLIILSLLIKGCCERPQGIFYIFVAPPYCVVHRTVIQPCKK